MTIKGDITRVANELYEQYQSAPTPQEELIAQLRKEADSPAMFIVLAEYFLLAAFRKGELPWSQGLLKIYFNSPLKDFDDRISYDPAPQTMIAQDVFTQGDLSLHPGLLLCILDAMELRKSVNEYIRHLIKRHLGSGAQREYVAHEPDFVEVLYSELPERAEGLVFRFNPQKYLKNLVAPREDKNDSA